MREAIHFAEPLSSTFIVCADERQNHFLAPCECQGRAALDLHIALSHRVNEIQVDLGVFPISRRCAVVVVTRNTLPTQVPVDVVD